MTQLQVFWTVRSERTADGGANRNMFIKIFNHIQAGCFKHDADVDDDGRSILSNTNSISIELLELQLTTNKNDLAESELVSAFIAIAIAIGIRFIEIQCLSNI